MPDEEMDIFLTEEAKAKRAKAKREARGNQRRFTSAPKVSGGMRAVCLEIHDARPRRVIEWRVSPPHRTPLAVCLYGCKSHLG